MKTVYIFLLGAILALFPGYSFAFELKDTDANVIGHVTDKDTKEHLSYVTILIKGTTIGLQQTIPGIISLRIYRKGHLP